jgi:hypothetical protein
MNPNLEIPKGCSVCPACNGTTRVKLADGDAWMRTWKGGLSYYDPDTDTKTCDNCGGQTMSMKALGYTKTRPGTDQGCLHEYTGRSAGRCYTVYTCKHCHSTFDIDSGD